MPGCGSERPAAARTASAGNGRHGRHGRPRNPAPRRTQVRAPLMRTVAGMQNNLRFTRCSSTARYRLAPCRGALAHGNEKGRLNRAIRFVRTFLLRRRHQRLRAPPERRRGVPARRIVAALRAVASRPYEDSPNRSMPTAPRSPRMPCTFRRHSTDLRRAKRGASPPLATGTARESSRARSRRRPLA